MKKKVLVLSANPKNESYNRQLADAYVESNQEQFDVQLLRLAEMQFNPDLYEGYDKDQPLEEALKGFQEALLWCDHLVIFTPIWWGALPAKLKGLIDRTFLPGFAFQYEQGKAMPKKLLIGKTARIVATMDTPPWYFRLAQGAPAIKQLKTTTLEFVGFKSVKTKMIGPIRNSTDDFRARWINYAGKLGDS